MSASQHTRKQGYARVSDARTMLHLVLPPAPKPPQFRQAAPEYCLQMIENGGDGDVLKTVLVTRQEFLALKRHLASMRTTTRRLQGQRLA